MAKSNQDNSLPFGKVLAKKQNYVKSVRQFQQQEPLKSPAAQNLQEQKVLKISMYSALILAIFGIGFGLALKSLTVVFDGFICLISVGLGAMSVVTSRYIYKDDDELFQYGYVRFEPMVNLFKSLVLIFVCVYAFINSFSSLLSGGYEIHLGATAIYSIFAFVFCLVLYLYTNVYAKKLESDLIRVDNIEWKIDCVLYIGALIAFGAVFLLFNTKLFAFLSFEAQVVANYIDPFLLCVLSFMLCIAPTKIAISNFKDLVMLAPAELDDKITEVMDHMSKKYGFSDYDTHTAKSGRFFMVEVNILVNKDFQSPVANLDLIRDEIERALEVPSYKIWLSISWTTNPKWL
ncbi:cation diffusion facilitator family transporter [Campylobacter troglodytis]|uniref:cation diffusion facilitator family transporter n=1 Tax=Campylobacter troglodytis TaxID=654363 RepID=UPI0031F41380